MWIEMKTVQLHVRVSRGCTRGRAGWSRPMSTSNVSSSPIPTVWSAKRPGLVTKSQGHEGCWLFNRGSAWQASGQTMGPLAKATLGVIASPTEPRYCPRALECTGLLRCDSFTAARWISLVYVWVGCVKELFHTGSTYLQAGKLGPWGWPGTCLYWSRAKLEAGTSCRDLLWVVFSCYQK